MTKLAAIYFAAWFGIVIWHAAQNTLEFVALVGGAIVGTGVIWRLLRRAARRARGWLKRADAAFDVVRDLPAWQRHVNERLEDGNEQFDQIGERLNTIDGRFEVIADANRLRVNDALAGDKRSPLPRRSSD